MIKSDILSKYIKFVKEYMYKRLIAEFDEIEFHEICSGINGVLIDWTTNNYVGCPKTSEADFEYQRFFEILHSFLAFIEDNSFLLSEEERSLSELMIYRGKLYRYLGIPDVRNAKNRKKVLPIFEDKYVSWSKNPEVPYTIYSKLYGE